MKNLKLKLARMEKDLSQTELAKQVGVTRQTIGMVEAGDYNPTLNLCIQICKSLDKTLDDLFQKQESGEAGQDMTCFGRRKSSNLIVRQPSERKQFGLEGDRNEMVQ